MSNRNPNPATRFKKGVSGNPGGRPKGAKSLSGYLTELGNEVMLSKDGQTRMSRNEVAARAVFREALDPKSKYYIDCLRIMLDRTEGKALERIVQQINLSDGVVVPRALCEPEPDGEDEMEPDA